MIDIRAENWLADLLPQAVSVAQEAGEAILKVYQEINPSVEYKADNSPLTQADLASHRVIANRLAQLTPDWPVLSEESENIPFEQRKSWRHFWMVDPLDGTKEFLRRSGEFTVNIALMEANAPILGVVYAPVLDKLYYAAANHGACRIEGNVLTRIQTAQRLNGTARTVVSRLHGSEEEKLDRFRVGTETRTFVLMGSSLKFCLVAEGSADIYPRLGPTMEWDTAAAQCILEEAGGFVSDLDGNPFRYNKPDLLNPGFLAASAYYKGTTLLKA